MQPYHWAWLAAHPERSEQWLRDRLADGFDVHHGDGDHSNNDPANLFLVETADHMRLHGLGLASLLQRLDKQAQRRAIGATAYLMRQMGRVWGSIGQDLGTTATVARRAGLEHATAHSLAWPLQRVEPTPTAAAVKRLGYAVKHRPPPGQAIPARVAYRVYRGDPQCDDEGIIYWARPGDRVIESLQWVIDDTYRAMPEGCWCFDGTPVSNG